MPFWPCEKCYNLVPVVVARRGVSVPARRVAKAKTLVEFLTVALLLLAGGVAVEAHLLAPGLVVGRRLGLGQRLPVPRGLALGAAPGSHGR